MPAPNPELPKNLEHLERQPLPPENPETLVAAAEDTVNAQEAALDEQQAVLGEKAKPGLTPDEQQAAQTTMDKAKQLGARLLDSIRSFLGQRKEPDPTDTPTGDILKEGNRLHMQDTVPEKQGWNMTPEMQALLAKSPEAIKAGHFALNENLSAAMTQDTAHEKMAEAPSNTSEEDGGTAVNIEAPSPSASVEQVIAQAMEPQSEASKPENKPEEQKTTAEKNLTANLKLKPEFQAIITQAEMKGELYLRTNPAGELLLFTEPPEYSTPVIAVDAVDITRYGLSRVDIGFLDTTAKTSHDIKQE